MQDPIKIIQQLPPGVTEYPNAIPRQAVGKNKRYHYCSNCGWVEGSPTLEPKNTPWPASGNQQASTLHRCRRCNKILAATGDAMSSRSL